MSGHASTRVINKYLDEYAEPETQLLTGLLYSRPQQYRFNYVLVIPAYRESSSFFDRLACSLMRSHSVLLIVVINQPDTLIGPDTENQTLLGDIADRTTQIWQSEHLQLRNLDRTSSAVLLADRFSLVPIPKKQGVGLARKLGADLGLSMISKSLVSAPWIYSSDADTFLPEKYFSAPHNSLAAAAVFPFQHICGADKVGRATRLYELRMRQYVDGLQAAGSPYAYHTLGSALAINATTYAKVRGFPKRDGGEDFYLLNKAAKTGEILNLPAPLIRIEARLSDRVPFGTGPAINRLLSAEVLDEAKIFYHPEVFNCLAQWLEVMPSTWSSPLADQSLAMPTLNALENLDIRKVIDRARQTSRTQETFVKHMHIWFDGFKTLRFIHLLRDGGLANVGLNTLTTDHS